jgi:hypothetical protein
LHRFHDGFRFIQPDELLSFLEMLVTTDEDSYMKHEGSNRKQDQHTPFERIIQGTQEVQDGKALDRSRIPEQEGSCLKECAATAPNAQGCGQGSKVEDTQSRGCSYVEKYPDALDPQSLNIFPAEFKLAGSRGSHICEIFSELVQST